MKIMILGYSGAGKSTLARQLGERYTIPVLHLDAVYWLPGWEPRPTEEGAAIVERFLDDHADWVIDGNYGKYHFDRRAAEADRILFLDFNRFRCLFRVIKRYRANRGRTRPDMGEGCPEKIDAEFITWILWRGRRRKERRINALRALCPEKIVTLRTPREVEAYLNTL